MAIGSFIEAAASSVLNELLSSFHDDNGMALPSRYEAIFLPPSGTLGTGGPGASTNLFSQVLLGDIGGQEKKEVGYQCNSISFPGRTLTTTDDTNLYGPTRQIVDGFTYGDITAGFYCHNDMREKTFFENWQKLAFNAQTFAVNYYDDYVGTIQIYQLDQKDNRRYGAELVECFPKTISEQKLSSQKASEVQTVDVTFSFRYWKNLTAEGQLPKPLLDRLQGVLANQVERNLLSRIPKVLRRL
jgi:hypothetical protein|tara:strand:- start:268 stop:996 length:729 start_codon:yes stop_codon:yes gene_type:complete